MSKETEIQKLANFIMSAFDGVEPSRDEGAGTTAIRIIKQLQTQTKELERKIENMYRAIEKIYDDECRINVGIRIAFYQKEDARTVEPMFKTSKHGKAVNNE